MWRILTAWAMLYLLLDVHVEARNEFLNTKIAVTPPSASCAARANQRPCPKADGSPILAYPTNYPCPCYPADGGGAVPATGAVSAPNPDLAQFVDELVLGGFNNPVSVAFTDNTNKAFVGTKQGQVWWVDLATKQVRMWIDLTDEVQNAGDRGLIGVVTNPNFAQNPYVFLSFTVDPVYGQPDEPENYAAIQRLIRLTDNNGATSDSTRMTLFGATAADAVYICFNTHALGQVRFGLDGSLIIATGEGAHWDIPQGDYGQNYIPTDVQCDNLFFNPSEDVGAFRAQSLSSLGGKILRLDPLTGQAICPGATNAGRYTVMNPFCTNNPNERQSKIWALGFRQSWRMNVRPLMPGETLDGTPGTIYTAEVGEGGFEEINVVRSAGQNLGWPCWEGPLPMAKMRDSPLATDPNSNPNRVDPVHLNCKHIYENVTTTLPFYFWSRWGPNNGDYGENHYLGLGFTGNTAGGVGHYTGNLYPSKYKYTVWIMDFSQRWIRVLFKNQYDQFESVQDFMTLGAPISSMEAEPVDGNMVYLNFGAGELHMIRYAPQNVPPSPVGRAAPSIGAAPLTVQFSSDGTFDRDGDAVEIWWTFGDGTTSTAPNPAKVYNTAGRYIATLFVRSAGVTSQAQFTINVGPTQPVPRITQPSTLERFAYTVGADITFSAAVTGGTAPYQYKWEINLIHLNHIHPDQYIGTTQTFTIPLSYIGADTHAGARINYYVVLTVTDAQGNTGRDIIFLTQNNFPATNAAPVPVIAVSPSSALQAGQPISITAQDSTDPDLDYLFYRWDWGDGTTLGAYDDNVIITSHTYAAAGTYTIRLTLTDNFGATAQATRQITIGAGNPNPPPAPTPPPTPPPVTPPTPNTYVSTVPGVVQIESYMSGGQGVAYSDTTAANLGGAYRTTEGVDLEVADDVGGGYSLGYIETGEWIKYQITVTQAGVYSVQLRYAYPAGTPVAADRVVTLLLDAGTAPVATVTLPPSGGWGVWQTSAAVTLSTALTAGTHQITVQFTNGYWRLNYLTFTVQTVTPVAAPVAAPVTPPTPPPNTIQLPGTVQAENYMPGGQGVAYYDTTPGNTGGALRNDDVDIAVCTDGANCYSVDYLEQGEWLRYQVTLTQSGTYAITARYAYPAGTPVGTARTLTLQLGTTALGTLSLAPATASWDTWATSAALNTAALTAGTYQLTVTINQGWWRFNSLQFTLLTNTPPPVTPPVAPPVTVPVAVPVAAPVAAPVSPSVVTALPGLLQVENYRVGGQGVAYYDTTPGNTGGAFRTDDVDLQNTNGEIGIGYIESGEWLTYQVNINTAGTYRVQARYAYPPGTPVATNRQLRLFIDNSATPFVTLSLPPTGDWTTWTYSAGVQTLNLPAGSHVLMMRLDYGFWTLDALQFTLITPTATSTARRALRSELADTTGPVLYFAADTFVSSALADQSSGTLPGLVVMNSEHGTSVALLQLNIGTIDLVESARVRLFNPRDVSPVNVTCHHVTADTWQEDLTWNNKVTWSDAVMDSQLVSNSGYYEWDITQLVQLTLAQGEATLSLALHTEQGRVVLASKEHMEITARPALIGQSQARAEQIDAESSQYMRDGPDMTELIPSTQLLVEGTAGTQSRAYVRYSIFNIPRKEVYRMRLFGAKVGTPGTCVTVRAYSADDSQWTDATLAQQPQFGVMIASTVICDTEPRWYEWDISLYVRQQITKDMRAITIGLDVTPLTPELSQDDSYGDTEELLVVGGRRVGESGGMMSEGIGG